MDSWILGALGAVAIGLLALVWARQRSRPQTQNSRGRKPQAMDALDTVDAWEPHGTRILSNQEREAYAVLARAMPDYMVLAQVPLSRFLRVPTRYSYAEWLKRVGSLSADLVVCDRSSEVLAVVEVRAERESERAKRRHERMHRVLKAAHIRLLVWNEGRFPSPGAARAAVLAEASILGEKYVTPETSPAATAPTPLSAIPVGEAVDSGPGDLHEPPPSTWFDDFDQTQADAPEPHTNHH